MALTFPRWLVGVVVACGLIWTGLFGTPKEPRPAIAGNELAANRNPQSAAFRASRAQVTRETDRLRLLLIRDSILAATKGAPPGLNVYIDRRFAETRATLDSNVRAKWRALGSPATSPVVVAALVDSTTSIRGVPANPVGWRLPINVFLPRAEGEPCLGIMRIPAAIDNTIPSFVSSYLRSPTTISSLVSACAYFAAFGSPGPNVRRWLSSTNWRYAVSTDWSAPSPEWKSREVFYRGALPLGLSAFRDGELALKSRLTMQGQACVAGRFGACGAAALQQPESLTDSIWRSNVVSSVGANPASFYVQAPQTALGPSDSWILSELVHDLGAERFATFWRSPLSVDSAFAVASGRSLDTWLRAWTARVYGTFPSGPTLAVSARVGAFAWIVVGLVIALVSAQRRRIQ